ncbi:hypothetical protein [Natrinema ejinorense]|uniref:Uncharacterized protein n=1 Tax=Natrinema ejinorense TaxID=373386 RepID=A0A2A5QUB5_9EURY|nr:hypothetical protein [Natrinema ejinorense]PCR90441.1 hypothetical protein CP557_07835 [Natrinema ejinorense]
MPLDDSRGLESPDRRAVSTDSTPRVRTDGGERPGGSRSSSDGEPDGGERPSSNEGAAAGEAPASRLRLEALDTIDAAARALLADVRRLQGGDGLEVGTRRDVTRTLHEIREATGRVGRLLEGDGECGGGDDGRVSELAYRGNGVRSVLGPDLISFEREHDDRDD